MRDIRMPDSVRAAINGRTASATYGTPRAAAAPSRPAERTSGDIRPEYASGYGPYGRAAQAELGNGAGETEVTVRAANSNTSPSFRRTSDRPLPAAEPLVATETVVPFNGLRPRPSRSPMAFAEPATAALPGNAVPGAAAAVAVVAEPAAEARLVPAVDSEAKIDVILSRETATLTVPAGNGAFPETLIHRLGRALSEAKPADAEAAPDVAGRLPPPVLELEPPSDDDGLMGPDVDLDPEHDDAITIAGRLRPAIPAE
jgi:hypothetical protein